MAQTDMVNGHDEHAAAAGTTIYLGKRKRTQSPEKQLPTAAGSGQALPKESLQRVLQMIRKHDTRPSLLNYPLGPAPAGHDLKRARLAPSDREHDTIEHRLLSGFYTSYAALMEDVNSAKDAILNDTSSHVNGDTPSSPPDTSEKLSDLVKVVANEVKELDVESAAKRELVNGGPGAHLGDIQKQTPTRYLALKGTTDKGPQDLFTGAQAAVHAHGDSGSSVNSAGKIDTSRLAKWLRLENGEPIHDEAAPTKSETRLFRDVFRPHRNTKALELPQLSKAARTNALAFVPDSVVADGLPHNKQDYKYARLSTGSWLSYGGGRPDKDHHQKRPISGGARGPGGHGSAQTSGKSLFGVVYSSFAPSSDSTGNIISAQERGQQWFHKHGENALSKLFASGPGSTSQYPDPDPPSEREDEFADVVANFEPTEREPISREIEPIDDVDGLLGEVSELLQTLASYQRNRHLEQNSSAFNAPPKSDEIDTFELLKAQLSILVSSLPPFAVAKLNGDQLADLNISTTILMEKPDHAGTSQEDDFTLRRLKAATSTPATGRPAATPQVRGTYATPSATNPISYNAQVRGYNSSVPATSAYGMRTAGTYQTPSTARPTYAQNSFQQSATPTYNSRPTLAQQFQRPGTQPNGYNPYSSAQNASYGQRPAQQSFQQAQQNAGRTSPSKPLLNGQSYQPRQIAQQINQTLTPQASNYAAQYASNLQRQYSGSPSSQQAQPQGGFRTNSPSVPFGAQPQVAGGASDNTPGQTT